MKKRKTVVKALCLHIAHDCNLPADTALQKKANIMEEESYELRGRKEGS